MASFDEVKLEDIVHDFFATYNPNTGANKNGDSLPTIAVYEEGNGTALTVTSSVTNVTTGVYRWQLTVAAADGFEAGKYYSVWITATVTGTDTVTQSTPVMSFKATARVIDDLATPTNINEVLEAYRTYGVAAYEDTEILKARTTQINSVVDEIFLGTQEIGTAGVGLSNIPWNSAWDSQVESECTDALTAFLTSDGAMSPGDERSPTDTNPITFSFPTFGAEITGQVSKNNAAYAACVGAFAFLRTEDSKHWYTLAFNAADRPAAEGTARYVFTDGIDTVYVTLRVAAAALDTVAQSQLDKVEATTAGTTTGAGTATEVFTGTNATVTVNLDNDDNRTSVVVS